MAAIKAVENINAAAIKGEHDATAEKALKATKERMGKDVKRFVPTAEKTAQIAAMGAAVLLAAATYLSVLRLLCPSAVRELMGSIRRRKRH